MNDMMSDTTNIQDGFIVRNRKKQTRTYLDNELLTKGYVAFLRTRFLVYVCLAKYANADTQRCYPSYELILKETGMKNRNTLARTINVLEYLRLIGVKRGAKGRSNRYYLLHHSQWRTPSSIVGDTARAVSKMSTKEYQKRQQDSVTGDTRIQRINSTKEIPRAENEELKKLGDWVRGGGLYKE